MGYEKDRLKWIDAAKGIAIILVVIGHVISSYWQAGLYLDSTFYKFLSQFIYSFHMALFMILSGILCSLKKNRNTIKSQLIQKLINYGIPYVIFSALWIAMKMLMSSQVNSAVTLKDFLLIPVYPISFMWFIYALFIMQVIQILVGNRSKKFKAVHLLISWGGWLIQPFLVKEFVGVSFSNCILNDFLRNYVFFLIGAYYGRVSVTKLLNVKKQITIPSLGILLICGNIVVFLETSWGITLYRFIIPLIGSLFIIIISHLLCELKLLTYIGRQSLAIYLLQGFAIAATRIFLTRFHLNENYGILPIVICTITGTILPLIAYQISTKIGKLESIFYPGKYIRF